LSYSITSFDLDAGADPCTTKTPLRKPYFERSYGSVLPLLSPEELFAETSCGVAPYDATGSWCD